MHTMSLLFSPPVRPICCNTELKLTYNKNRHESSTGYWHCGSNDRHPELEQRMWFLLSSNSISRNPTLPPSLWIHEKTRSEGSGSSARKWRVKGLWGVKESWKISGNTPEQLLWWQGGWITKGMDECKNSFALDLRSWDFLLLQTA